MKKNIKKIGILTLHRPLNYGAVWQCWALKTACAEIGAVPVDFSLLKAMYPNHKSIHNKISELENEGKLIRLKKAFVK